MVAGSMYWEADRKKRKEFDGAVTERKAKEKNAAWIRELEARDEEEKEIKALREKRRLRESNPKNVNSMVEYSERRTPKVTEMVRELLNGRK